MPHESRAFDTTASFSVCVCASAHRQTKVRFISLADFVPCDAFRVAAGLMNITCAQGQKGKEAEQCLRNNESKLSSQCKGALTKG